jgi:hypothetical protein
MAAEDKLPRVGNMMKIVAPQYLVKVIWTFAFVFSSDLTCVSWFYSGIAVKYCQRTQVHTAREKET